MNMTDLKHTLITCVLLFVVLCSLFLLVRAEKETAGHGSHNPTHHEHYPGSTHDAAYDHEAILGSHDEEMEYNKLPPAEAKTKLRALTKLMDTDGDGQITKDELTEWVTKSFFQLDKEESLELFHRNDENGDGKMTFDEILTHQFGYTPEDIERFRQEDHGEMDDYVEMIDYEKRKFNTADMNKDGVLNEQEFLMYESPFDYEVMHELELERVMKSMDKNGDAVISFEEFVGDRQLDEEGKIAEEEQFSDLDQNKDGHLDTLEAKAWILPDSREIALEEAEHLIEETDTNNDMQLSIEEIIDNYSIFVGSQVTNYGKDLRDEL